MPVVTRIANPFEISDQKRFTALQIQFLRRAHVTKPLENLCRPYGTRFYLSTYPALTRWAIIVSPLRARFCCNPTWRYLINPCFEGARLQLCRKLPFTAWALAPEVLRFGLSSRQNKSQLTPCPNVTGFCPPPFASSYRKSPAQAVPLGRLTSSCYRHRFGC